MTTLDRPVVREVSVREYGRERPVQVVVKLTKDGIEVRRKRKRGSKLLTWEFILNRAELPAGWMR